MKIMEGGVWKITKNGYASEVIVSALKGCHLGFWSKKSCNPLGEGSLLYLNDNEFK